MAWEAGGGSGFPRGPLGTRVCPHLDVSPEGPLQTPGHREAHLCCFQPRRWWPCLRSGREHAQRSCCLWLEVPGAVSSSSASGFRRSPLGLHRAGCSGSPALPARQPSAPGQQHTRRPRETREAGLNLSAFPGPEDAARGLRSAGGGTGDRPGADESGAGRGLVPTAGGSPPPPRARAGSEAGRQPQKELESPGTWPCLGCGQSSGPALPSVGSEQT